MRQSTSRSFAIPPLLAVLASAPLVSCGDDDDDGLSFVIRETDQATNGSSPIAIGGIQMVYLADEGTSGTPTMPSQDLNGDGDDLDDVAVVVNLATTVETVLRAAVIAEVVGREIYVLVDESLDGMDWDGDMVLDDSVLLHWSESAGGPTFVDLVDVGSSASLKMIEVDGRLYYQSATPTVGADDTSLRYLTQTDPTLPVVITNVAAGGTLRPEILGEVEGLLFLVLSELAPLPAADGGGPDYNSDGDSNDEFVLALLDGTDEAATVMNVGLAMADGNAPFDAYFDALAPNDWLVGFLVNELAQGGTSLNDQMDFAQPLLPDQCAAVMDVDADDDVLHFLRFADFVAGMSGPVNTGLAGADRVVCVADFVATISPEANANCDLNNDLDDTDRIPRWVEALEPVTPPRDPSQLHAAADPAGGSRGLAALSNRLVMVVDEAADSDNIDGKPANNTLVGWLDPTAGFSTTWTFAHPTSNPGTGIAGEAFVGTSWMAAEESEARLPMVYQESVPGLNLNNELFCGLELKDGDSSDVLPMWVDFQGAIMDFDGQGYALEATNPGIVVARGFAFYRVSEAFDSFDYNQDGDTFDAILFRNPQTFCATAPMATSSSVIGPVIETDGETSAAFLTSEFSAGIDINGDGDQNDLVVRYFLF